MAKKKKRVVKRIAEKKLKDAPMSNSKKKAIWVLILNLLPIVPGAGTLLAGKTTYGYLQIILWFVAVYLVLGTESGYFIGMALGIIVWMWAVVFGLKRVLRK